LKEGGGGGGGTRAPCLLSYVHPLIHPSIHLSIHPSLPPSLPPTVFWWVLEWLTPVFPFKIRFSINLVKCSYKNCPNCRNFVGKKSVPKTKNYYFIYFYMRIFGR
jgi:hypothetical protein